jgi:hypothetical protein
MTNARRSRTRGRLRGWAGDSLWRQFLVWLLRNVVSLLVLGIGLAIVWFILMPNMIDGLTKVFAR